MIKASVIGSTGYAGQELIRLLNQHPEVKIKNISSHSFAGEKFSSVYENYNEIFTQKCEEEEIEKMVESSDVIFIALPHGIASSKVTKEILSKTKVIDLGADYRIKSQKTYEDWYGVEHSTPELLKDAVYGLCEINREKISKTNLIANPGCYTTCSILSLYPLVKESLIDVNSIIIDSKSGVSGAGRGLSRGVHYNEVNESIKAYKIAAHRHTPEIEQELSIASKEDIILTFTPHLVPMNRGILSLNYASLKEKITYQDLKDLYNKYYKNELFVRILKEGCFPETKWVKGSNFCDIGFKIDERTNRVIVVGAIDNLVKGAAGQAIQNMNILFDLEEKTGIDYIPVFPG